jgi:hypothetical protein
MALTVRSVPRSRCDDRLSAQAFPDGLRVADWMPGVLTVERDPSRDQDFGGPILTTNASA